MDEEGWPPRRPSAAERTALVEAAVEDLRRQGIEVRPVRSAARSIAVSFWGRAWCEHLEKFSDFANRLPRGRTYLRTGSVCHLEIRRFRVESRVCGSDVYRVSIAVRRLPPARWKEIRKKCAGEVASIVDLLQGKLTPQVMSGVTDRDRGLFPQPGEIEMRCSCPDQARMCKHVAAALYGVGVRLDETPELLFLLRGVDHRELVGAGAAKAMVSRGSDRAIDLGEVSRIFGIELGKPSRRGGRQRT